MTYRFLIVVVCCLFLNAVEIDFGKLVAFKHNIIYLNADNISYILLVGGY